MVGLEARIKSASTISSVLIRIFRYQRMLAEGGKVRFGDQVYQVAEQIEKPILNLYLQSFKASKGNEKDLDDVRAMAKQRSMTVARSIVETTRDWLEECRELRSIFGPDRIAAIALTEESNAKHEALAFAVKRRKGKLKWIVDRKPCSHCQKFANKIVMAGKSFGSINGVVIYAPPAHPNCLLGETPIFAPGTVSTFKAFYSGTIFRIVFSNGDFLSCTPNHQLLTTSGLTTVKSLVIGNDVINCSLSEFAKMFDIPDNNQRPLHIKDFVTSSAKNNCVTSCSVPVSSEYLHGDASACYGKIDIVRANSFLRNGSNSSLQEHRSKESFLDCLSANSFDSFSYLTPMLSCLRFASDSGVCGISNLRSFLSRHFRHSDQCRFMFPSRLNSVIDKMCSDDIPTYQQRFRQREFTLPSNVAVDNFLDIKNNSRTSSKQGNSCQDKAVTESSSCHTNFSSQFGKRLSKLVTATKVVKIETFHFNGPVYDLHTKSNMYIISNGIVSSNCRCKIVGIER